MSRLCGRNNCRRLSGHNGNCSNYPSEVWNFFNEKDKNKLSKTAYATPRGGKKGAYQNHVYRNNKVIVPYERTNNCDLSLYSDGYIIRLLPEQVFDSNGNVVELSTSCGAPIVVGENAFVLYRSHEMYEAHPPPSNWSVRHLEDEDGNVIQRRKNGVVDCGHYILRLPAVGGGPSVSKPEMIKGPAQGIFAPEYASKEITYLSQVVLAWQIVHTVDSPYTSNQAAHLKLIISELGMDGGEHFAFYGMMRGELSSCPLCMKKINYSELHSQIYLDGEDSLLNSGAQIQGATRSTIINLFHMMPLEYGRLFHTPQHVAWGHATCNTKLGQRRCWSLEELKQNQVKVGKLCGEEYSTFGWMSDDEKMIRSPLGAVWIRITEDMNALEVE